MWRLNTWEESERAWYSKEWRMVRIHQNWLKRKSIKNTCDAVPGEAADLDGITSFLLSLPLPLSSLRFWIFLFILSNFVRNLHVSHLFPFTLMNLNLHSLQLKGWINYSQISILSLFVSLSLSLSFPSFSIIIWYTNTNWIFWMEFPDLLSHLIFRGGSILYSCVRIMMM